jgi:hypothetical protein
VRWATRAGVHIDRAACAWLVRRFLGTAAISPTEPQRVRTTSTAAASAVTTPPKLAPRDWR